MLLQHGRVFFFSPPVSSFLASSSSSSSCAQQPIIDAPVNFLPPSLIHCRFSGSDSNSGVRLLSHRPSLREGFIISCGTPWRRRYHHHHHHHQQQQQQQPPRRSFVAAIGDDSRRRSITSELYSGAWRFQRLGERLANASRCCCCCCCCYRQEAHKDAGSGFFAGGSSSSSIIIAATVSSSSSSSSSFSCLRASNNNNNNNNNCYNNTGRRICVCGQQRWTRNLAEVRSVRFGCQEVYAGVCIAKIQVLETQRLRRRIPVCAAALRRHGSVTTVVKNCRSSCKGLLLVNAFEPKPQRDWFKEFLFQPIDEDWYRRDEDSRVEEQMEQDRNTNGAFKSFDKSEEDVEEGVDEIDDVDSMPAEDDNQKFTALKRNRDTSKDSNSMPAVDNKKFIASKRNRDASKDVDSMAADDNKKFTVWKMNRDATKDVDRRPADDNKKFTARKRNRDASKDVNTKPAADNKKFTTWKRNRDASKDVDRMPADDKKKFMAWERNRDATKDVREFQGTGENSDSSSRGWEDWLDDTWGVDYTGSVGAKDGGWFQPQPDWERGGLPRDPPTKPERGMRRNMKEILFRFFEREEEVEEDLLFEQRVFRYTSQSTAKFVAGLILVPWLVDFVVHDFVMVPFLERYVEVVPLAAKVLDVRESQKLQMIEHLKLERQRVRFEAEIGQAPPLSDHELAEHIRLEALHLREELRAENRQAFANIWSDLVAGFTVLLLLVLNSKQVAIMRMTGDRLVTNVSDTGKAFIIILLSDIFLGYHSELGWETVIEMVLDHYGLQADQASIYIFVAIVPVTIDACFKLWVFRYLSSLSASAAATFREMQRH